MVFASLRVVHFGGNEHYAAHGLVQGLFAVSVGAECKNGGKHRIGPLLNRPVNVGASIVVGVLSKRRPTAILYFCLVEISFDLLCVIKFLFSV